ncbi:hypothetical protein CAOG_009867 [Capsaspora owczarzaki ATCC 30864]|uniref:Uncharacterized protein n=1 Tax=Capsaspora owczarzaki (strain ATCC 30864) TaxID=595528 RepID=A0A0D2UIT4_CAPO3|nr:hypothetical protein CAOG_009867 [Capsaspora owczarzaki ATCC 30864]
MRAWWMPIVAAGQPRAETAFVGARLCPNTHSTRRIHRRCHHCGRCDQCQRHQSRRRRRRRVVVLVAAGDCDREEIIHLPLVLAMTRRLVRRSSAESQVLGVWMTGWHQRHEEAFAGEWWRVHVEKWLLLRPPSVPCSCCWQRLGIHPTERCLARARPSRGLAIGRHQKAEWRRDRHSPGCQTCKLGFRSLDKPMGLVSHRLESNPSSIQPRQCSRETGGVRGRQAAEETACSCVLQRLRLRCRRFSVAATSQSREVPLRTARARLRRPESWAAKQQRVGSSPAASAPTFPRQTWHAARDSRGRQADPPCAHRRQSSETRPAQTAG